MNFKQYELNKKISFPSSLHKQCLIDIDRGQGVDSIGGQRDKITWQICTSLVGCRQEAAAAAAAAKEGAKIASRVSHLGRGNLRILDTWRKLMSPYLMAVNTCYRTFYIGMLLLLEIVFVLAISNCFLFLIDFFVMIVRYVFFY